MSGEWSPPESDASAAPAAPGVPGEPQEPGDLMELVRESWQRLRDNPGPAVVGLAGGMMVSTIGVTLWYVILMVVMFAVAAVAGVLGSATGMSEDAVGGLVGLLMALSMVVVYPVLFAVIMPAQVLMMRGGLITARGEPMDISSLTANIARISWRATLLSLLMVLALIPAALLLYIPAIYLGLRWSLALYYLMDTNLGVMDALKASWRTTDGHVLDLLVKHFVFGIGAALVALFTCYLGFFVVLPLQMVFMALIYTRMSGRPTSNLADPVVL